LVIYEFDLGLLLDFLAFSFAVSLDLNI